MHGDWVRSEICLGGVLICAKGGGKRRVENANNDDDDDDKVKSTEQNTNVQIDDKMDFGGAWTATISVDGVNEIGQRDKNWSFYLHPFPG